MGLFALSVVTDVKERPKDGFSPFVLFGKHSTASQINHPKGYDEDSETSWKVIPVRMNLDHAEEFSRT